MKMLCLMSALMAAAVASPLAGAQADCATPDGRATMRFKYSQAMAAWQENDPDAFAAAQDQMHADQSVAQRAGDEKLCVFWTKYIRLSHR